MTHPHPDAAGPDALPGEVLRDPALAFDVMVRENYGRLCAFACRLTGSRELAQDVVHDVLLRVWRDRERFEFRHPLAYLYRAVRNEIISNRRRGDTRRRILDEVVADGVVSTSAPDVAISTEGEDLAAAAARAVASLPERCRLVYTMRREQELSYADIARVLDVTPKTVENQMSRALKLLRARLAPYLPLAVVIASSATDAWKRFAS